MKQNPTLVHRTFTVIKYSRLSNINESVCVLSPCRHLPQLRWNADSTERRHPFRDKGIPLTHQTVQIISKVLLHKTFSHFHRNPKGNERMFESNRIGEQHNAEEGHLATKKRKRSRSNKRGEREELTFPQLRHRCMHLQLRPRSVLRTHEREYCP